MNTKTIRFKGLSARDMLAELKTWHQTYLTLMAQYDKMEALFGAAPESPFSTAMFEMWGQYTKTVSRLIGDTDQWLDWFEYECHMGDKPLLVQFTDGKQINVKSLFHLVQVMRYRPKKTETPLV